MSRSIFPTSLSVPPRSTLALWLLTCLSLLGPGCGTETGNPGDSDETVELRSSVSLLASSHLLEASEMLEDSSSESLSLAGQSLTLNIKGDALGLVASPALGYASSEKSCIVEGKDAVVNRTRAVTKPVIAKNKLGQTIESNTEKTVTHTKRFTRRDGVPIACDAGGKFPVIPREAHAVLTVTSQFESSVNKQILLKAAAGETIKQTSTVLSKSGLRKIVMSLQDAGTDNELYVRTITSSVEQKIRVSKADKTNEAFSTIATANDEPLVVALKKAGPLQPWATATLQSGTLLATLPTGARTETRFENVVIDRTAPCTPQSGSITGTYYPAGSSPESSASNPELLTYEISFEEGTSWIRFNADQDKEELPFSLCPSLD